MIKTSLDTFFGIVGLKDRMEFRAAISSNLPISKDH